MLTAVAGMTACQADGDGEHVAVDAAGPPPGRTDALYRLALRLEVTSRARPNPEALDTGTVILFVDSVAGDSVFGAYAGGYRSMRLRIGSIEGEPQLFAARFRPDSVWFELTPEATDAGLVGGGVSGESTAHGEWYTEALGRVHGTFDLWRIETPAAAAAGGEPGAKPNAEPR